MSQSSKLLYENYMRVLDDKSSYLLSTACLTCSRDEIYSGKIAAKRDISHYVFTAKKSRKNILTHIGITNKIPKIYDIAYYTEGDSLYIILYVRCT